jgi:hypothetical protein
MWNTDYMEALIPPPLEFMAYKNEQCKVFVIHKLFLKNDVGLPSPGIYDMENV